MIERDRTLILSFQVIKYTETSKLPLRYYDLKYHVCYKTLKVKEGSYNTVVRLQPLNKNN